MGLADWKKYLVDNGYVADPNSKLAKFGKEAGLITASGATGGLISPGQDALAVMQPSSAMLPDTAPTRVGGAVQDVGIGAQNVAAEAKKPGAVFAPGADAGGGPGGPSGGIDFTKFLGGQGGSAGGWSHMEAAPVAQAYEGAFGQAKQAIGAETEANKGVAQAESNAARMKAGVMMDARQQAMDAEARRQNVIAQHNIESQKAAKDLAETDTDPDSYYGQGAGAVLKRSFMMIASALGGYSAGLRGGPNTVQESIDKDIDRFVQGQKAEYQKKAGLLQQSNSRFGQLMQQFGDERAAEAAMKQDMYGAAAAQGEGMLADAKNPVAEAQGQKVLAGLSMQEAQHADDKTKYIAPTAGMSKMQQAEWLMKMKGQEAALKKTDAETAKLERGDAPADKAGAAKVAMAQTAIAGVQAQLGAGGKHPGTFDLGGRAHEVAGEFSEGQRKFDASLADAARSYLSLKGGRQTDVPGTVKELFGNGSPEEIKAGLARIKATAAATGGNVPEDATPETFKE